MNKLLQEPDENPNRSTILRSERSFLNTIDSKKDNNNLIVNMEDSPQDQMLSYDSKGDNSVNNQQYFLRK